MSGSVRKILFFERSWVYALVALLSARHFARLLHSFASALEKHWPGVVDKAIILARCVRHWRECTVRLLGMMATSLLSVGLDAAGQSVVSSTQSLSTWKANICREIAVSLYTRCVRRMMHDLQALCLKRVGRGSLLLGCRYRQNNVSRSIEGLSGRHRLSSQHRCRSSMCSAVRRVSFVFDIENLHLCREESWHDAVSGPGSFAGQKKAGKRSSYRTGIEPDRDSYRDEGVIQ